MTSGKRWVPLESNPEVLTTFASALGLNTQVMTFHDVYGLDDELLAMIPTPVKAVIMLFPITDKTEAARLAESERLKDGAQTISPNVYFMKQVCPSSQMFTPKMTLWRPHDANPLSRAPHLPQTIGNACGTIAVLHSVLNNASPASIPAEDSFLAKFFAATKDMDPAARGKFLEDPPEGAPDIEGAHQAAAQEGQTAAPGDDEDINLHFVALVHVDGGLYELDGRKEFPIHHGPTGPDSLLKDSTEVVKKFMRENNSHQFTLIAVAPPVG